MFSAVHSTAEYTSSILTLPKCRTRFQSRHTKSSCLQQLRMQYPVWTLNNQTPSVRWLNLEEKTLDTPWLLTQHVEKLRLTDLHNGVITGTMLNGLFCYFNLAHCLHFILRGVEIFKNKNNPKRMLICSLNGFVLSFNISFTAFLPRICSLYFIEIILRQ